MSCDCFKTVICTRFSLIFDKNTGSVYRRPENTLEQFREALKIHFDNSSEKLLYKYY